MFLEFICPPVPHLITAGTSVFRPGDIHERRIMKTTFDLIVITKGILYIQEDDNTYALDAGDFLILRPDHLHRGFRPCTDEVHFNWLHFATAGEFHSRSQIKQQSPRRMSHKQYYKREQSSLFLPQSGHLEAETLKPITDIMNNLAEVKINHNYRQKLFLPPKMGLLESQQLFISVLSLLQQKEYASNAKNLAARIYAYIASHSKQPFSLDYLAKKFSYHKVYIIKVIKDSYSVTPAQLHTIFRMEDAKALLENTQMDIQDIAGEVGYEDPSYFSKQFKKYISLTPKEYRARKTTDKSD